MRHFSIISAPYGTFAVTANADGSIGLNAQVVAAQDKADREGNGLRALVEQANAARELWDALDDLRGRCDSDEGVRADGSNIQTIRAHAILDKYAGMK